jgi:type I restriction enzyme S subunit
MLDKNQLPAHWEIKKLGEVCDKITDGTHHTPEYTMNGIPFISVKDIKNGKIDFSNTKFVSKETHLELIKRCNPEKDDILITKSGTIGRLAIVPDKEFSLFVSVALLKIKKHLIDSKFGFYALQNHINHIDIQSYIKGGVVKNYHLEDLRQAEIPLPPLPEQQAIVAKIEELLSELDKGTQQLETAQAQLKIYRQAVLKWAFEGKLTNPILTSQNPKNPSPDNELPEGWKWVKLGDLGSWKGGGTPNKQITKYWNNGTNLWVTSKDMKFGIINDSINKITDEAILNSSAKRIDQGSILFVMRSGILRHTFPVAIAGKDLTVNQDLQTLKPNALVIPKFIFWYIKAFNDNIRQKCSKDGTTVESIETSSLKNYPFLLPPLEEQNRIVEEIESRLSVCDKVEESIRTALAQAEVLRQSILKRAFEGKLV